MRVFALIVALGLGFLPGQSPNSVTVKEAKAFIALLTPEQRVRSVFALDSEQLTNWHFVPRQRPGVAWRSLSEDQKRAGHALLKSTLSKLGYEKVEAVRALEPVLYEMENRNPGRDESNYAFSFFGDPSDSKPWAWRYEGHHLSLTFIYRDGRLVASSPQFLGSNPAEVDSGPKKGTRVLAKEQDIAHQLLGSLSAEQKKIAIIADQTTGDIVTGASRVAAIEGRKGLGYGAMTKPQQELLLKLLRAHAEVQSDKEQARRMKQIEEEELSNLVFAWMGATERRARNYYRIQGKNLIVEFDNSQNNGNHIHTVWRNRKEDFGGDLLKEHYEHGHEH